MRLFSVLLLGGAVSILGVAGCGGGGGGDRPKLVPVSGTVKVDGQPTPGVSVMFFPLEGTRGTPCYANADDNGRYELLAGANQKGAAVGEYKVTCSKYVMPDGSLFKSDGSESPEMAGAKEAFPPQYSDQTKTTLKATVPDKGGTFDFEVKTK